MDIIIEQVFYCDKRFLDFYKTEINETLSADLYPIKGLPTGLIAIDQTTNTVVGAAVIMDEDVHNNVQSHKRKHNNGNPWLMGLIVIPSYQKRGIGKQLVDSAMLYCHKLNFSYLNFNTETAIDFYKKHWKIHIVSTDFIIIDNENLLSDTVRMDIKENLTLKPIKVRFK